MAPVVAAVASIVALLVAVDQLTQRSRMRRVAEWTKQLADGEANDHRTEALQQLRAMATAHMVASVMVPPRYYVETILMVVAVPFVVIRTYDSTDVVGVFLSGVAASWLTLRRGIRVHLERYRIAAEYWRGEEVSPPKLTMLYQVEGGTRSEFVWAILLAVGLCTASLGTAEVIESRSSLVGLLTAVLGVGLVSIGAGAVRRKTPPLLHS
ncbi:hypothetical protein [Cellulosimicrobium sp. Marseille-Q4280]|uniref:hypothetical protein n=1 Tax=Cellulosimicrobium sp. Marseille-Q4280 TaxID=2937992 RepID=UPI002041BF42|nr:hypothetical protein [Cellulosimicrobium sp. Marseille-Q4280]